MVRGRVLSEVCSRQEQSRLARLTRICSPARYAPAFSFGQWLVRWHCWSKEVLVPLERYNSFANPDSIAGANHAVVPTPNESDCVWTDDPVIVSTAHIKFCCLRVASSRGVVEFHPRPTATLPFDAVLKEGALVGLSTYPVHTANVRGWFSPAMLDEDQAINGDEVTLI